MEDSLKRLKKDGFVWKIKGIVLSCFLSTLSLNFCWGTRKEPVVGEEEGRKGRIKAALQSVLSTNQRLISRVKLFINKTTREILQGSMTKVKDKLKEFFNSTHGDLVQLLEKINAISGVNQYECDAIHYIRRRFHIHEYQPSVVRSCISKIITEKHSELNIISAGREIMLEKEKSFSSILSDQLKMVLVSDVCDHMVHSKISERFSDNEIANFLSDIKWTERFKIRQRQEHRDRIAHELMTEYGDRGLLSFAIPPDFQGMKDNIQRCHHELTNFALVADPRTDAIFKFNKADARDRSAEITDEFIQELQRQHDNLLFIICYAGRVRGSTGWVLPDRAHNFHEILDLYVLKYGQLGLFWKWSEHGWLDPKLCLRASAVREHGGCIDNVIFQYAFGIDNICYHRLVAPVASFHRSNPCRVTDMNIIKTPTLQTFAESRQMFFWIFQCEAIKTLWRDTIARSGARAFWGSFSVVSGFDLQRCLGPLLFGDYPTIVPYVPNFLQYVQRGEDEIFALEDINKACSINNVMTQDNTVQIFAQCPHHR